jgi:hypothetical protein
VKKPVSNFAFQTQPAALQRGGGVKTIEKREIRAQLAVGLCTLESS